MSHPSCLSFTGPPFITYKAINSSQPPYFSSLIKWSDVTRGNFLSISSSKLNKHSWLCSFTVAAPTVVNKAIIAAKETKRLFERIWRRNKSHFNRSQYMQKVHQYNRICMQAKSELLKAKIQDNHHDPKNYGEALAINLPRLLADRFVEFFTEKIKKYAQFFLLP